MLPFKQVQAQPRVFQGDQDPEKKRLFVGDFPTVQNQDGSHSNVMLGTFGTDNGFVVGPTMYGGKQLSNDEAWQKLLPQIDSLPRFDTQDEADSWAQSNHSRIGQDGYLTQDPVPTKPLPSKVKVGPLQLHGGRAVAFQTHTIADRRERKRKQVWQDTTRAFLEDTLPSMTPDPKEVQVVRDAIAKQTIGGDEWGIYQSRLMQLPEDRRGRILGALDTYNKRVESAYENPLSVHRMGPEQVRAIYSFADDPKKMQVFSDIAHQFGDEESYSMATGIQRMVEEATVRNVLMPGPSGEAAVGSLEGQVGFMHSGVDTAISQGKQILDEQNKYQSMLAMNADEAGQRRPERTPAVNLPYQNLAYQFSQNLEKRATERGLSYEAIKAMPATAIEAKQVFETAMETVDGLQVGDINRQVTELQLRQSDDFKQALKGFAASLWAYGEMNPDANVGELLGIISGIASGHITKESEVNGNVPLIIKAFDLLMAPDRSVAAFTTAAAPKVRPTEMVFDDGYVAYNTLDATNHAIALMDEGGVWEANPDAVHVSEYLSRGGALGRVLESAGEFGPNVLGAAAGMISWAAGAWFLPKGEFDKGDPRTWRRYGDPETHYTTAKTPPEVQIYAKPVGVFEAVSDWTPHSERWENFKSAWADGEGSFIFEQAYAQATNATSGTWATKLAAGLTAAGVDGVASPWNAVGTGVVATARVAEIEADILSRALRSVPASARREAEASKVGLREVIFGESRPTAIVIKPRGGEAAPGTFALGNVIPTSGPAAKGNRKVRYRDGRVMSEAATAQHDIIAKMFGIGGQFNEGGAQEIAEQVMTMLRDSPEQTIKGFMETLEQHPKFLDGLAVHLPQSGAGDGWRKLMTEGVTAESAKRRWAQGIWENSKGEVESVLESGRMVFGKVQPVGGKNWQRLMENTRGVYIGGFGIPVSRAGRHIEAVANKWKDYLRSDISNTFLAGVQKYLARPVGKIEASFRNGAMDMFAQSHWSTGLAADKSHMLPEIEVMPWRMRQLYAEKFRRVMVSASQRAQTNAASVFKIESATGGYATLEENKRKLVALATESGEDARTQAKKMWENKVLLEEHGVKVPATFDELVTELDGLQEYVARSTDMHNMFADGMVERGLLEQKDLVDGYVLHFYHKAEQNKILQYMKDLDAKLALEQSAPGAKAASSGFNHGTSAKVRQGPVDLYEAMKYGFDPELDAAQLLYVRSMQFLEVDSRAQFLERLAADFGEPVIHGKEALAKVLRTMHTNNWVGSKRMFDAVEETSQYYAGLARVRSDIHDSQYRELRSGLTKLANALDVPLHSLKEAKGVVVAMTRSDKFWEMASSKSRNILDKIMPKSLRAELREHGREVRSLRALQGSAREYLHRRGFEPGALARLTDDDLGVALALQSEKSQFGESFNALKQRMAGANRAKVFVKNELRQVESDVRDANSALEKWVADRDRITNGWDTAKKMLTDRGYDPHGLSGATSRAQVKRTAPDIVPQFKLSDDALFDNYKEFQAKYRENFLRIKETKADLLRLQRQAGTTARRVEEAEGVVASANSAMQKRGREYGQHKGAMRQHGKELLRERSQLEKSSATYVEASRRLREVEGRIAFLMDGPAMQETTRHIRQLTRRSAAASVAIRNRINRFAFENNISASTARHRALTPVTIGGVRGQQKRAASREVNYVKRLGEKRRPSMPVHVPAESADRYQAVDDFFRSFGWSEKEQSTLLWEVFGAHHLTEIPVKELEALVSAEGGMYAKMGRFLYDPTDIAGLDAVLSVSYKGIDNAWEIAKQLGLDPKGMSIKRLGQILHKKLDDLFDLVEAGDKAAVETLSKIDPKKLSKIYVAEDVTGAFAWAKRGDHPAKGNVARMAGSGGKSTLQNKLANTYIPLELGLVHRQMVREGVTKGADAERYVMSTYIFGKVADALSKVEVFNRMFKSGVLVGRPNFKFIHRNGWFDGGKSILHLGLWGVFNPKTVEEFHRDMRRFDGFLETAAGPVSMAQFHNTWQTQGVTVFAARMDDVNDFSRAFSAKGEARMRKNFGKQLEDVGRESSRTKGAAFPKTASAGAGIGAILGQIAGGLGYEGASVGFTAGYVARGLKGGQAHTAGRMPTAAEWFIGHGAAANESLENFYRAFAYYTYVKSGQGTREAIDRANIMLRDYSNLKPFAQEILSKSPFLFWNFTQQNAIAMTERFLEAPARVTLVPRMIQAISEGIGEQYRDEWQTMASSLFYDDKVAYMSDELEAAVGVLEPFYQLLVNRDAGAAMTASGKNFSPFLRSVIEQKSGKLPDTIARKFFDEHGPLSLPGIKIYQNSRGGIVSETSAIFDAATVMFGLQIAINDAGRIGGHAEKGDFKYAALEFLGFGNYYDQESFYEGRRELMDATQRRMYDALQEIKVADAHGTPMPWAVNLSAQEKSLIQDLLGFQGGEYVFGTMKKLDKIQKQIMAEGMEPGTATIFNEKEQK